jgi:hypothetical protein
MTRPLFLFVLLLATLAPAGAKYWASSKAELIKEAAVIAVVEVTEVAKANVADGTRTYEQQARARPVNVLKGQLPKQFEILAKENYDCAQSSYKPGRYLVFLKPVDSVRYATASFHMGQFLIQDDRVLWFEGESRTKKRITPLETVLGDLKVRLADGARPDDTR